MSTLNKPRILCSACLEHCKCRYDGSVVENTTIKRLQDYVEFVTVCPEMGIGLPSPREAVRVVLEKDKKLLLDSYSGTDRTADMKDFIEVFFGKNRESDFDGVILKCKSPTCGIKDVKAYAGFGKLPSLPVKTSGFFGDAVKHYFDSMPVEDEGRLKHFNIREHFFQSVFLRHRYRAVKEAVLKTGRLNPLIVFHSRNKYLFMAYNQQMLKKMGKIVANHEQVSLDIILKNYEQQLCLFYNTPPSIGKNINMLLHLFGYFKTQLTSEEKAFFLDKIALYQDKKIPYASVLSIIQSWVIRFDETYLKDQSLFDLFPVALMDVTDSGKGL